jgi:uncharacterized membrane protein SpoIIM required for sporulation
MELTLREIYVLIHGIVLGSAFLLSYGATMVWFTSYNLELLSDKGRVIRNKRMKPVIWILAIVCWLTVISGTFITYPWYRAIPADGADLSYFPQALLASSSSSEGWHSFGMEWKEHIAWLSPFIFTPVAYIATMYGEAIAKYDYLRKALMLLLTLAFVSAGVAALLGALITKNAPIL